MDSLPEDVTVRTLIKRMIAEEAPQSIVRPGKQRLRKSIGNPKKLTDVSMPQSPHMILRSQMKARVQQSRKQIAATAGSSAEHSTRKNMSALRKTKRLEAVPQENLDDYTPRQLLKKFIQTELESSLVKVTTSEMKKSVEKTSQLKTKLQSDSDRFDLSLPAEVTEEQNLPADHKIHKRKKVSVSEFEKAMQQRLDYTTEPQESEQVELCEKSIRPPDISTIVGLINPDFEESTTKPILCRRPVKRKVINEDEFEKGVHNYLEQNKEPEETETERSGPFEKTAGLTDISGMVGSINFGTDESVSKPVLSRRSRRLKLISEDDFEQRVLFDLQQTKGKSFPEVQEAASDNTEKEKSITNAQQNELGVNEPYTSPQQTPSDGMEAVSARNEETRNEFGLNTGLDLEKQREFVVSDKEESVKTPHTGKDQTHLTEQKTLADTDPDLEYRAEKFTEDPHGGDKSMDHELEMPKDTEQNLSMQVSQQSTMVRYSEGIVVGNKNDKTGEGHEVNDGRAEDGETGGILADTGRMEYAEEGGEKAEGAKVDNGSVEAEDGENIKDAEVVSERMEGVKADEIMQGAKVKGTESSRLDGEGSALAGLDGEGMAGGDTDDERMEETESDGDIESDEMDEEELIHNDGYEGDDSEARQTFQLSEKALKSSPLLTTPHFLKILGRQAQKPLAKVRGNPKKPTQKRKKTILPSSFVKSVFTHYAKMRVKKEVFRAVDQCLELYFKQLCDDMDVYSKHAKRRTIEKEDLELLMKRQGFITAKTPLNVLIENHLPMECREKLIPMAVSGSKIIPKK